MACIAKENAINYLIKHGGTDDVRKVINYQKFDEINNKLTGIAEDKYGLKTNGNKLFTIQYEAINYIADTPTYRENKYTVPRAIPNDILFEELDRLIRIHDMKKDQGLNPPEQPMMMRQPTPEVDYNLKLINGLNKISRNKFEPEKLQGWLNDLQKQGIPAQQLEIFKNVAKSGMTKEEIAIEIAANYSYTIEINTATEPIESANIGYDRFTLNGDNYSKIDTYRKNGNVITKEEYNLATEQYKKTENLGDRNTQYYSNLTVLGGTNYIENEIATPEIFPFIEGHAQFATKNGIGWFRSDEQVEGGTIEKQYPTDPDLDLIEYEYAQEITKGGKPTKTRRILEVQSDLFQKGRDLDDLIADIILEKEGDISYSFGYFVQPMVDGTYMIMDFEGEAYENFDTLEKANEALQNKYITGTPPVYRDIPKNQKANAFLQILNKDNNWVNFFIKSIIQDSAKKGYEKVLFPSGNTASKVEGHTTLEEFKKGKEDRIKEIEKLIKTNKKYYNQAVEKKIRLLKKLETSDFLKKEDLGYIYNSKEKTVNLINKKTNDEVNLSHGYWSNSRISYVNSEKEAKLVFDKFIKGEKISDGDILYSIDQVSDLTSSAAIKDQIKKYDEEQVYYTKRNLDSEIEIDQLKQELARVEGPEGFGALKPIYNFYENTVFNVLKKQGYNPKQIQMSMVILGMKLL